VTCFIMLQYVGVEPFKNFVLSFSGAGFFVGSTMFSCNTIVLKLLLVLIFFFV